MNAYARIVLGRLRREESGQLLVMVIGFAAVLLLLVGVVANASSVFLARRSLASVADGAAVVAAQSLREQAVYAGEVGAVLPLSRAEAVRAVGEYAAAHRLPERFDRFAVTAVDVDTAAGTVRVEVASRVPVVLLGDLADAYGAGIPLRAGATARAPLS